MKKVLSVFSFIFSIFLCSCQLENKHVDTNFVDNDLFTTHHYSIPLDSLTGFESECIQYLKNTSGEQLLLFYKRANKINFYDFKEKKLIKTVSFAKEGPNGVGTSISGFRWVSDREIYLSSYWERRIYLVDVEGNVKKKFDIKDDGSLKFPVIDPNNNRPIIKAENDLILAGTLYKTLPRNKIGKPFVSLNLKGGTSKLVGKYPEKIFEGDWDIKDETFFDFNESSKKFIVAFAISDSVMVTDLKDNSKTEHYSAKSSFLKEIKPLNSSYDYEPPDSDEANEYVLSGTYWNIKYDQFQKVYYRFGILPRTLADFQAAIEPKFFISVFDDNFKPLGESILPEGLFPSMATITPSGLLIPNRKAYDKQDDFLSFDVLTIKKK
jgi:hypothetical protein